VFAIGSSYGWYGSLLGLIPELKPDLPAAFISALYSTPSHVDAFCRYLDDHSPIVVSRAVDGQVINPGSCYLASVFEAVSVVSTDDGLVLQVQSEPSKSPARVTDELMTSLSTTLKDRASGILLSGIGEDGVKGIGQIISGGGNAIVQDPKTCLCSDTTALAAKKYGLSPVLPGPRMAETIHAHCQEAIQ
jgi:two-component system chemotaxis response regulator CheB